MVLSDEERKARKSASQKKYYSSPEGKVKKIEIITPSTKKLS